MAFRVIRKIISLILLSFSIFLAGCQPNIIITPPNPNPQTNSNPQIVEVYNLLEKYYYKNLPVDISKVNSVDELLSFVDRYTYTYTSTRSIDMGDRYVGLGITIQNHDEGIIITDINKLTSSDEHVYVGDIITHVNEQPLKTLSFDEKSVLLRGESGDEKRLKITRFTKSIDVTMHLFEVPFDSIEYKQIGHVGYIKIIRFANNTGAHFLDALTILENAGITALLIDVRDNGGGYLDAALDVLKLFINDDGYFVYIKDVKQNTLFGFENEKTIVEKTYPIHVLVNRNSASASEVVAGTLKQYGHQLIGEKTYGKDVYQSSYLLTKFPPGTYLSITRGYWLLKDQSSVEGGIEVDIEYPQAGVLNIGYPVIYKTFKKGDSHVLIESFQYLLSRSQPMVYEPGLFDDNLEAMVLAYQMANHLPQTKQLDEATQIHLIDLYRTLIKQSDNDHQLNYAINYVGA